MSELCRSKTVIVIAHRLNTIRNADTIIVIDHGTIRECGTHTELMDTGGLYSDMVFMQSKLEQRTEGNIV